MCERVIDVTAAIWMEAGKVLIARRPPGVSQAGLWEFPGGKVQPGETPEACLVREIEEELGVRVEVEEFFAESVHAYADKLIRLLAYRVRAAGGTLSANDHDELRWVEPRELENYAFCPADLPLVRRLQGRP
ncbi:MAG TPA: (deoxy)nucleoside triphosphate pyrophosphohydrolase [Desulfobacterales bacterium]|nr:(deoxy)nucleoside triphosphate pyrophosphohydrolase [Desulfobacterales bacterium]